MATKKPLRTYMDNEAARFPVTIRSVVGEVILDGSGDHGPIEAAFLLIAQHGESGYYEFPGPSGGTVNVEVNFPHFPLADTAEFS